MKNRLARRLRVRTTYSLIRQAYTTNTLLLPLFLVISCSLSKHASTFFVFFFFFSKTCQKFKKIQKVALKSREKPQKVFPILPIGLGNVK
jgi:hypothetical protein